MPIQISVIIHTVNPRLDLLLRVFDALRAQTLTLDSWELLVVDNASDEPLAERLPLDWHPNVRCLLEERRGASSARLRGLRAAAPGTFFVFIDDDNLPAPDYLEQALAIAAGWPMLGAWGGQIDGVYDEEPPGWLQDWKHHLAVRSCGQPVWSAFVDYRSLPFGAGLCVRRQVGERYVEKSVSDPDFWRFGRQPGRRVSGDDQYLCFCAEDLGFGVGRFPQLRLRHVIPGDRFAPSAFLALVRGNAHGAMLLHAVWKKPQTYRDRLYFPLVKMCAHALLQRGMWRRIQMAQARGEFEALLEARRMRRGTDAEVGTGMKTLPLKRLSR